MKTQISFLAILLSLTLFLACSEKNDTILPLCETYEFTCVDPFDETALTNDCLDNHDCTFTIHENSGLDYANPTSDPVIEGKKTVFKMFDDTQGDPTIADDEFTKVVTFEVDSDLESFSIENGQLNDVQLRFINLCFCSEVVFKNATSGCIEGQKIDENFWQIQVNADFEFSSFTRTVVIDAIYEVQ